MPALILTLWVLLAVTVVCLIAAILFRFARQLDMYETRLAARQRMEEDSLELSPEARAEVSQMLHARDVDMEEVIAEGHNTVVRRRDILKLKSSDWLNDEIINFYLGLIVERSRSSTTTQSLPTVHAFSSYFMTSLLNNGYEQVRRWTKNIDIFGFDIVLVPLYHEAHWALLVIKPKKKRVEYYDSLPNDGEVWVQLIGNYLVDEYTNKRSKEFNKELNISKWVFECSKEMPSQDNGSDCGVFLCRVAECITRNRPLNFDQSDMAKFRKKMVYEIIKGRLL